MSDSLVRVSRRAGWGARRTTPGARWCRSTPRRRVLGSTIKAMTSPRAYQRPELGPPPRSASVHTPSRSMDRLSPFHIRPGRNAGPHPLPSRQFQALFDSLFKVLFIFPSRGLGPGPSLRTLLQTTIQTPRATDSQAGLFSVRSPLLRESLFSGLLTTSRAANRPRRRDLNTSPDHSIGRSDGRCVQRAGT
ncbi:hypothetical protein V6N13_057317 [Hibiscus sabdariffa]